MTIGKIREVIRNKRIFQGFKVDRDLIFGVKLHLDLAIGLVTVLAISVTIVSKAAPGEFSHLSQWSERIDMFVAPIILLWGLPQIVIGLCLRLHHPFQKGLRRVLLTLAASFTARPREGTASTQHPEPPRLAEFLVGWCTSRRHRNALLQDLEEDFQNDLREGKSVRRAKLRYWAAAVNSITPQLWAAAKRIGVFVVLARSSGR
ncbi:MAG: hypothetical protein WCF20_01900 [Methylovirgula sp.]